MSYENVITLGGQFVNTNAAVCHINRVFGNVTGEEFLAAGHTEAEHIKYISGQLSLIAEERKELFDAKNDQEKLDAIGDIITVVEGLTFKIGFDVHPMLHKSIYLMTEGVYGEGCNPYHDQWEQLIESGEDLGTHYSYRELALAIWANELGAILSESYIDGFDPEKVYWEVHTSNMTKLCKTNEEAAESIRVYNEKFNLAEGDLRIDEVEGLFVVKVNRDIMMGEKPVKAGKFLKSYLFKEPDFSDVSRFYL